MQFSRVFMTAVFSIAVVFCVSISALAADVDPQLANAEGLIQSDKPADAAKILDDYLAKNPSDARAHVDRGDALVAMGKARDSIRDYSAAIAINPQYAYAYASRCDAYEQVDEYQKAVADCDTALSLKKSAYAFRERAKAYDDLGEGNRALADADAAVALDPSNVYSLSVRCAVRFHNEKYKDAEQDCLAALGIDGSNYRARFFEGRIGIVNENWSMAAAMFSKILSVDAADSGSLYWRSIARLHLNETAGALEDVNSYIKQYVDDADGYYVRALIEQRSGSVEQAEEDATTAARHYLIDNDTRGAAKAQQLLDELEGKSKPKG